VKDRLTFFCSLVFLHYADSAANGKAEPQRRVGGTASLDKCITKTKRPRYNERRRRCRLQRVLGGIFNSSTARSDQ
jgi:hypothetical protein